MYYSLDQVQKLAVGNYKKNLNSEFKALIFNATVGPIGIYRFTLASNR